MTRTGIKLDLDVGDLVSNAGRAKGAISAITEAMKKAEQEGRFDDYGKLAYEREKMQGRNSTFEKDVRTFANNPRFQSKDTSGNPVFKVDSEYASLIKAQTEAMKKLTAEYETAIRGGDFDTARALSPQIEKQQADFHKLVEETASPLQGKGGIEGAVKAIGIGQIASAINDGFSQWVSSLDRSGIINQYGSGDILGGRIAEQRRSANFWGGLAQAGLGIAGTAAGFALGGPGGALVGGSLGTAGGQAINSALNIGPNKEATEAAYAGLWESRSREAMNLAANLGDPTQVRGSWRSAADTAARYGYSAEEGVEAMKEAAQQGLGGEAVREVTQQVFQYERATGADRGTVAGLANMSARYGGGDALRSGWAGLQASGMKTGQYSEYLRAMQRVMEEGISKGFIRSSDQVAHNLAMLAQMTNNNPLWQGENGARRLMEMNAGLENATGLQSTSDVVAFRAARNIAEKNNGGNPVSYIEAQKVLEGGLYAHPELFDEYMKMTSSAEGGSREGMIERMIQTFGLNYTNADILHKAWIDPDKKSTTDFQKLLEELRNNPLPIPDTKSPELNAAKMTESIKNFWTGTGQTYWDDSLTKLQVALIEAIKEYNKETGSNEPVPPSPFPGIAVSTMPPDDAVAATRAALAEAHASGDRDREAAALEDYKDANYAANAAIDEEANNRDKMVYEMAEIDKRKDEIKKMLTQTKWGEETTFFTGNGWLTENDDEKSYNRLMDYEKQPKGSAAYNAFFEASDILESFPEEYRKKLNESNDINRAIPDVMTDKTGQALLEAIRNLQITINVP